MINAITKGNKNRVLLILLALFMISSWFYWFQYRPTKIRQYCHRWIVDLPGEVELYYERDRAEYSALYDSCLHEKGLK